MLALCSHKRMVRYRASNALPYTMKFKPCGAGFHLERDFIHQRWISPVEGGFHCVLVPLEHHALLSSNFSSFFTVGK